MKMNVLVIVGPTASGKSDLAITVARSLPHIGSSSGAEIISADSRQVYRGLDIGTGKVTHRQMKGVEHHLLDVANPRRRFTAERYRILARHAIENIWKHGKLPIICGGTGFYIDAILNESDFPTVPPNSTLRKKLSKKSPLQLLAILKRLDPARERIFKKNPSERQNARRIVRAIEIAKFGKMEKKSHTRNTKPVVFTTDKRCPSLPLRGNYNPRFIGIQIQPAELKHRINVRLEKRLRNGLISEVRHLHEPRSRKNPNGGLTWKRLDELGLEYRYVASYLQGKLTKKEMVKKLTTEINRYAKRQMTWFKRNRRIRWITSEQKLDKSIFL